MTVGNKDAEQGRTLSDAATRLGFHEGSASLPWAALSRFSLVS
jgi:hypothetical protein